MKIDLACFSVMCVGESIISEMLHKESEVKFQVTDPM
jgi:hypothetical protein